METEMKNEPKLLSASTIKYMLKTPDSFRIKYSDLYIENYEFHEHLILGNAIHKVAEHYTNTNERKPQVGLDYIYEQLMNFDEGVDYLPEIVVEMETRFHNALKGLFEVKNETGLVEQKITLPDFKGYIDFLADELIIDYKTVGQFLTHGKYNPNVPFPTKEGYLIQLALYAYWYHKEYDGYALCKIVEILKKDTAITEPGYIKKSVICDMIQEQHGIDVESFRNDRKMTREILINDYPIRHPTHNVYQIQADEEFVNFGKNLYEISLKLRKACLDVDMEAFKQHHKQFKRECLVYIRDFMNAEYEYYKDNEKGLDFYN